MFRPIFYFINFGLFFKTVRIKIFFIRRPEHNMMRHINEQFTYFNTQTNTYKTSKCDKTTQRQVCRKKYLLLNCSIRADNFEKLKTK